MATDRSYVVVLRAESAVRLPESEAAAVELTVNEARGTSTIRLRTRYVPLGQGEGSIPRTLWIEAYGPADTIDEAMQRYQEVAGVVGSVLSVATNASVEDMAVEIAFDATEASTDHDYFQQFLPDESGLPRASRRPDGEAFLALFGLLLSSPHRDRLLRTVSQYQIALQHLTPGHEILALAHLWMAVEALTKVARRQATDEAGGQDQLLLDWGIGKQDLDGQVRKRLIFQSDIPAYKEAAEASNGFEHGFLDFAKIRHYSTTHVGSVAGYVRSAIIRAAGADEALTSALLDERFAVPMPCARIAKYLRATLVGPATSLAPDGMQYPNFRLNSAIQSVKPNADGSLDITPQETMTAQVGPGVEARDVRFEMWGPDTGVKPGGTAS